jgi:hypothetical protein
MVSAVGLSRLRLTSWTMTSSSLASSSASITECAYGVGLDLEPVAKPLAGSTA